jgi:hypothetical protein
MLTELLRLMVFVMSDELSVSCMSRRYLVGKRGYVTLWESRFDSKELSVRHRVQYCGALKVSQRGKQEQQLEKHASSSTYS